MLRRRSLFLLYRLYLFLLFFCLIRNLFYFFYLFIHIIFFQSYSSIYLINFLIYVLCFFKLFFLTNVICLFLLNKFLKQLVILQFFYIKINIEFVHFLIYISK